LAVLELHSFDEYQLLNQLPYCRIEVDFEQNSALVLEDLVSLARVNAIVLAMFA
jgi:hypothetical protein